MVLSWTAASTDVERVSVLIVDDHAVVRAGLRLILEAIPHISVVAEASSGAEALEMAGEFAPSVVLMDIVMPDMDGLQATRQILERFPHIRVVMMSVVDDPDVVARALRAGAAGYLHKTAAHDEICGAVEAVARGYAAIKAGLLRLAVQTLLDVPGRERCRGASFGMHPPGGELTGRELAVLRLLVEGRTNREIGRELQISTGTSKKHVERILAKLGASDRTDAVAIALRTGLVE